MTSYPIFYFSSKKENPKTYLHIHLKNNQNSETSAEFKSNFDLDLKIDDQDYLLNIDIVLNCEINKEPQIETKYNITKILSPNKLIFNNTVNNLISFMDDFKYKIKGEVDYESKKVDILEAEKKVEEQKSKELLKIQEDIKLKEHLEKIKIEENRLKLDEDIKIDLQNKIDTVREGKPYLDIVEDMKIYNTKILLENHQLKEENKFDETSIIKYLKEALESLKNDDEELSKDKKNIEKDKIQYFKEKYNVDFDDDIIKNKKDLTPKSLDTSTNSELQIEDEIYTQLLNIMSGNKDMIFTNLIYIVTELMKFVENFNLEGVDKKKLIIESIRKFLIVEHMNNPEINIILDKVCPELIDILLLVDKRKIIIKRKIRCFIPWFS